MRTLSRTLVTLAVILGGAGATPAQTLPLPTISLPLPTLLFPTPTPTVTPKELDHFTCYKARVTRDTPKFNPIPGVTLVDTFRASTVEVKRPKLLCAPTNKFNEDPTAPFHADHLEDYRIKPTTPFVTVTNQKVVNQFGEIFVDAKKPVALQVPTAKGRTSPPAGPPADPAPDHLTCYKIRVSSGQPKFHRIVGVQIRDQFGPGEVNLLKPKRLCVATNKNNEEPGAENHPDHLLCYKVKDISQPRLVAQTGLYVHNQFGPGRRDAIRISELCVPSQLNPAPPTATPTPTVTPTPNIPCGNGVLDLPDEQCDPAAPPGGGALCDPTVCVPSGATADDAFACTCATGQIRTLYSNARLDAGWNGVSHDQPAVTATDFDSLLFDCDGVVDQECRLAGPRPGRWGFRCELNPRVHCATNADCGGNGRCTGMLGPPLPVSAGGVPVCATSVFPRSITGTFNVGDATTETFSFLLLRVHLAEDVAAPCPRCNCNTPLCMNQVGDTGTCSAGLAVGQACTIEGTSVFGPMSRDCPPNSAANISGGGLDIRFLPATTGVSGKTANLPCTAPGFGGFQCPCDTCAGGTAANGPCASDADCPGGGVCGGLRCIGGQNDGQQCVNAGQCPPGPPVASCGRPGVQTRPNECEFGCQGGTNAGVPCADDSECPGGSCGGLCVQVPGEQTGIGECALGPSDGACSLEPYRSCSVDAQCAPPLCSACMPGQTCQFVQRPCHVFPMQLIGQATPFVLNDATQTLVTSFCLPPTSSPAVNSAGGLPGEGAIIAEDSVTKKFPADPCPATGCP